MSAAFSLAGWTLFGLAIVVGLVLDVLGLFGNWVILAAVGIAWIATGFERFGPWCLATLAGLALLGEVIEAAAAGYGAKRFGGGAGAMVAALVGSVLGAVLGTPWFPVVGTLAGACVGAFVAAALYEYTRMEKRAEEAM